MRVLVIGSGGREHAIVRALRRDSAVTGLHAAPGNPGIAELAQVHEARAADPADVARLAKALRADLVVIGPEAPLVAGVADALRADGIAAFGPDAGAARIEGSKSFAKEIMAEAGIPTARSRTATTEAEADAALNAFGPPYVVKDDALAAGKGVVVTRDLGEARRHAASCGKVVIEEYLDGPEVSLFALADGATAVPLLPAQDFKRAGDGDQGPNTGGMGAYTPLPWAPPDLADTVLDRVVQPAIDALRRRGAPYRGLLYAGLALTSDGVKVVEFNARFGDPETQVVLDRLATPLAGLLHAAAAGDLAAAPAPRWLPGAAVTVVIAAEGYPGNPVRGDKITFTGGRYGESPPAQGRAAAQPRGTGGRPPAGGMGGRVGPPLGGHRGGFAPRGIAEPGAYLLHAGTAWSGDDLVSAGGRVLNAVGSGPDLTAARAAAYEVAEHVRMRGAWYRHDIASRAARRPGYR